MDFKDVVPKLAAEIGASTQTLRTAAGDEEFGAALLYLAAKIAIDNAANKDIAMNRRVVAYDAVDVSFNLAIEERWEQ